MSRCSNCDRELPGFDTLCAECFEARSAQLEHPEPFLQAVGRRISNPFGITAETKSTMTLRPAAVVGGIAVLFYWYGAFALFGYHRPPFSSEVLSGALFVLLKSACLSLALSLFLSRKNLGMYWEVSLGVFLGLSFIYSRWAYHVGVFHERLWGIGHH